MELTVTMAHPPRELSPNGRVHWRAKARSAQSVRRAAMVWAQTATHYARVPNFLPKSYRIVWHYKGRMPDDDNVVARCKAALDGCCDVFNIDDRLLKLRGVEKVHALHQPLCGYVELIFDDEKGSA